MNIAVLASGKGSNFEALCRAAKKGDIKGKIKLLVTDVKTAYARKRAKKYDVPSIFVDPKQFKDRRSFDKEIVKILRKEKVELVVLAGFMRIITPYFVRAFKNRIMNIHPALLPSFKGTDAINRAHKYGVKVTGVTVHFVDDKVDHGPVVFQKALEIRENESLEDLEERIHRVEHSLYPKAVSLFSRGKLLVKGRKVFIRD